MTGRPRIFTVGHSTHDLPGLLGLLRAHGVEAVADVRAHPGSRRMPRFNREELGSELAGRGIGYRHLAKLVIALERHAIVAAPRRAKVGESVTV